MTANNLPFAMLLLLIVWCCQPIFRKNDAGQTVRIVRKVRTMVQKVRVNKNGTNRQALPPILRHPSPCIQPSIIIVSVSLLMCCCD